MMRNLVTIVGLHNLFHVGDFFIRQIVKVAGAFMFGKTAIVLQTKPLQRPNNTYNSPNNKKNSYE